MKIVLQKGTTNIIKAVVVAVIAIVVEVIKGVVTERKLSIQITQVVQKEMKESSYPPYQERL